MKVAVPSMGDTLEAQVDSLCGRALLFLLYDTERGVLSLIHNVENALADELAGVRTARRLVDEGVQAAIAGHCGPRAFEALSAAGVRVYVGASGTVAEALEDLKAGKLLEAHWGNVPMRWPEERSRRSPVVPAAPNA